MGQGGRPGCRHRDGGLGLPGGVEGRARHPAHACMLLADWVGHLVSGGFSPLHLPPLPAQEGAAMASVSHCSPQVTAATASRPWRGQPSPPLCTPPHLRCCSRSRASRHLNPLPSCASTRWPLWQRVQKRVGFPSTMYSSALRCACTHLGRETGGLRAARREIHAGKWWEGGNGAAAMQARAWRGGWSAGPGWPCCMWAVVDAPRLGLGLGRPAGSGRRRCARHGVRYDLHDGHGQMMSTGGSRSWSKVGLGEERK